MDFSILLLGTFALSAPLAFAAMGGLMSERSGIVNIALEGKMLGAAAIASVVATKSGQLHMSLLAGILAAILIGWMHFALTQIYDFDHIVSGMAMNALAYGVSNFVDRRFGESTYKMPDLPSGILPTLALVIPIALAWWFAYSRFGLRITAVGEDPLKAQLQGINPLKVRFASITFSGLFCGLGGALVVYAAGSYVDNITAGRGYIALAALILGRWQPLLALIACLTFGFFDALQIQLQGTNLMGANLPPELWKALPYLATLLALAGFVGKSRPPAALGQNLRA